MRAMRMSVALLIALALSTTAAVLAQSKTQSSDPIEKFSFMAKGAPKAVVDPERMHVTLLRWSTDKERDAVFNAVQGDGSPTVLEALRSSGTVGYLRWPGGLEYSLRYAWQTKRPDGGTDILLIADRPVWVWWDTTVKTNHTAQFAAVQISVTQAGTGEGRVTTADNVVADKATGIAFKSANEPVVITDLRRERTTS